MQRRFHRRNDMGSRPWRYQEFAKIKKLEEKRIPDKGGNISKGPEA